MLPLSKHQLYDQYFTALLIQSKQNEKIQPTAFSATARDGL